MRVVIAGVGGVGTRLARELPMYLSRATPGAEVVLVDGDVFEPKNRDRQDFSEQDIGVNKAAAWAEQLRRQYPDLVVSSHSEYLTEDNVDAVIADGDVVFCAVDNHASRLLLSERVSRMRDGVLISGGNDFHDGNVQLHVRRDGEDATPPITHLHPEIADPSDPRHGKNPAYMSCEELAAAGSPQLQFANIKVATEMLSAFWVATEGAELKYSELYFDLKQGTQRPIMRRKRDDGDSKSQVTDETCVADRQGRVHPAA